MVTDRIFEQFLGAVGQAALGVRVHAVIARAS